MNEKKYNRWIILLAATIGSFCLGGSYAWSVFQKPLMAMYHWTPSQVSMAFTLCYVMMGVTMIVAGRLQDQHGPRRLLLVGGFMWGGGIALAGFATTLTQLYLAYGVISGLGNGIVHSCVVANTVKWFPDKKGVATGLVVAGAGVGAMVSAPIISSIVYGYGVAQALHALGLTYVLVIATASMFVMLPPDNYQSDLKASANRMSASHGGTDKTWKEMVQDPLFYVLWTMYALGASSGLMIIGHAVSIGQELSNLSVAMGALSVSIISLANTCGRVSWGYLSDKIGCYQALMGVYLLSTVSMSLLVYSQSVYSFILAISIVGLCYGGVVTIFPTVTADLFGSKHLGLNFGILFTAFAAAALVGPRLAAQCKEITGTYSLAFTIGIVFGFCGIATTLLMIWRNKLRYQQQLTAQAES
ncbi:hypothetical protein AXX12_12230 [Anaerosporomusa subterranea]|uniref:Major facilitator superfamily (MFS) profile domain-containing protein n=1 Tax=Anaerosporomusa subterranea TaxID=1794912 RepID=A0A154BNG5_ANASB|nr:OFA family MFS transporter [Anaerosporomusa subterranea]KYZ75479.1 hypothetical protein AXX12_12230 [Anaerosporomusa subterranea]